MYDVPLLSYNYNSSETLTINTTLISGYSWRERDSKKRSQVIETFSFDGSSLRVLNNALLTKWCWQWLNLEGNSNELRKMIDEGIRTHILISQFVVWTERCDRIIKGYSKDEQEVIQQWQILH